MRIIIRNGYCYLIHSFRREGKVMSREKYLGERIPSDIEQIKEHFLRECLDESVGERIQKIRADFDEEWKRLPPLIKKKFLVDLAIDFTYNTNAIEGSTITLEETEDLIKRKIAPHKPLRDVQETIAHADVFFRTMESPPPITLNVLLAWHAAIFGETKQDIAGKLRDYRVRVGSYVAPDWQDVEKLMKEFVAWLKANEKTISPIEIAARAHYRFEKIHPFGDGNGRIGRLIIAAILQKHNYPPLVIEFKKRSFYYRALEKTENDFVLFFFRRYLTVHKKYSTAK